MSALRDQVRRVMIVDDEPDVRQMLQMLLGMTHDFIVCHSVSTASDALVWLGQRAVRQPEALPHIVILDLKMPGHKHGQDIIEQLLALAQPAIVVYTGFDEHHFGSSLRDRGIRGFVVKTRDDLLVALRCVARGGRFFSGITYEPAPQGA